MLGTRGSRRAAAPPAPARRRRTAAAAAGLLVLALPAAFAALTGLLRSPEQVLADAAAPEPSLVTAPVERRVLDDLLVLRGRVTAGRSAGVVAPVPDGHSAVVTAAPLSAASEVGHGDLVVAVSGRPVFALQGAVGAYRDLRPGSRGADVAQLQEALGLAGLPVADPAGTYATSTEGAVRTLYERAGFEPALSSPTVADDLAAAERAVAAAEAAGAEAGQAAQADALARRRALEEAERSLAAAREQHAVASAEAAAGVALAEQDVAASRERLQRAGEEAEAARRSGDSAAVVAATEAVEAARQDLARAEAAVPVARAAADARMLEADHAVTAAADALSDARAAVAATGPGGGGTELEAAREALARLRETTGVIVPAGEVVFVEQLPAAVAATEAAVGVAPPADRPLLTLSTGRPILRAVCSEAQRRLLEPGAEVLVTDELSGETFEGRVEHVADRPAAHDQGEGYEVVVAPERELEAGMIGAGLLVKVVLARTPGAVLVVPATALYARADGTTLVTRIRGDGTEDVRVRAGLSAGGFVEVTPVGGSLRPGDRVVVRA